MALSPRSRRTSLHLNKKLSTNASIVFSLTSLHVVETLSQMSSPFLQDGPSFRLITPHNISIGFKSGEFGGHPGTTQTCCCCNQSRTFWEVWQGAPSCKRNQFPRPWTRSIDEITSDLLRTSMYSSESTPFEHLTKGVRKPALMPPHTIIVFGNFTFFAKQLSE